MWIADDDAGLMLDVLEVHEDGLLVHGEGDPFLIRPPRPSMVPLAFDDGDPASMVQAALSLGYAPLYIPDEPRGDDDVVSLF